MVPVHDNKGDVWYHNVLWAGLPLVLLSWNVGSGFSKVPVVGDDWSSIACESGDIVWVSFPGVQE